MSSIDRLLKRHDFRLNPLHALWKRFYWRLRRRLTKKPLTLNLKNGCKISVPPSSGTSALIYYQGSCDPQIANFILHFLKPGMAFLDGGAHIGEFSLLAANAVIPDGWVHAFEPNPDIYRFLIDNVNSNGLKNIILSACAIADMDDSMEFDIFPEPSISSLKVEVCDKLPGRTITVKTISLDSYWRMHGAQSKIDLIKLDIEGAELLALRGAADLLSTQTPVIILEVLPANMARFGYSFLELEDYLTQHDYRLCEFEDANGLRCRPLKGPSSQQNLIATKDWQKLNTYLQDSYTS